MNPCESIGSVHKVLPAPARRTRIGPPAQLAAALALTGLAAIAESTAYLPGHPMSAAGDAAVAVAWSGAGLVLWTHSRPISAVMIAVGITWLLGDLHSAFLFLHRGPLAQVLLAYPSGRLASPVTRVAVGAAYADAVADPGTSLAAALFGAGLLVASLARCLLTSGVLRRERLMPAAVGATAGAVLVTGVLSGRDLLPVYEVVLCLSAIGVFVDLRTRPWARDVATGLIVDLGRQQVGTVRGKLARAVGDPSLEIAYLLEDERATVDEAGLPVSVPPLGSGRAVTRVELDGRSLALLIHDRAALQEPVMVDAACSALAVAVANVRLQAEIRARMLDVESSTGRLLDAAETQRRRLAAELRARVQPTLDRAGRALVEADRGDDLRQRLRRVQDQLARLAAGLDPPELENGGLATALGTLAAESAMPVRADVPAGRYPRDVERCAWFVCSEALANVVKHANASRAWIEVRAEHGVLNVTVSDDGDGGANPRLGAGLRRLAERVEAVGGHLSVESGAGSGTRVAATLDIRGRR
jgi:signal transduction histidine kinase